MRFIFVFNSNNLKVIKYVICRASYIKNWKNEERIYRFLLNCSDDNADVLKLLTNRNP